MSERISDKELEPVAVERWLMTWVEPHKYPGIVSERIRRLVEEIRALRKELKT